MTSENIEYWLEKEKRAFSLLYKYFYPEYPRIILNNLNIVDIDRGTHYEDMHEHVDAKIKTTLPLCNGMLINHIDHRSYIRVDFKCTNKENGKKGVFSNFSISNTLYECPHMNTPHVLACYVENYDENNRKEWLIFINFDDTIDINNRTEKEKDNKKYWLINPYELSAKGKIYSILEYSSINNTFREVRFEDFILNN